jgi:hypothetical protein
LIFGGQRKSAGEEHDHFPAGNTPQIFRQAADGEQHASRAKVRRGISERGQTCRRNCDRRIGIHGRALHSRNCRSQQVCVRRKILHDAQRASKINHRHHAIRPGIDLDEFLGCAPRLDLVRHSHRRIVKEENQIAPLPVRLHSCIHTRGKGRKPLLLVVFENFEFRLRQVVDVSSLLVRHNRVDQYQF